MLYETRRPTSTDSPAFDPIAGRFRFQALPLSAARQCATSERLVAPAPASGHVLTTGGTAPPGR
jgi:hypothetical protein